MVRSRILPFGPILHPSFPLSLSASSFFLPCPIFLSLAPWHTGRYPRYPHFSGGSLIPIRLSARSIGISVNLILFRVFSLFFSSSLSGCKEGAQIRRASWTDKFNSREILLPGLASTLLVSEFWFFYFYSSLKNPKHLSDKNRTWVMGLPSNFHPDMEHRILAIFYFIQFLLDWLWSRKEFITFFTLYRYSGAPIARETSKPCSGTQKYFINDLWIFLNIETEDLGLEKWAICFDY